MKSKLVVKNGKLSAPRFFPFNPTKSIQNSQKNLEKLKLEDVNMLKSTDIALRVLAVDLFNDGEIDKAILFSNEALKININCFNCMEVFVRNSNNTEQLHQISDLLTQAIILSSDPLAEDNKISLANYYKSQALKKMAQSRRFSALRLFEEALKCDSTILGEEIQQYLPYFLDVIAFTPVDDIQSFKRCEILTNLGIDNVTPNPIELIVSTFHTSWAQLSDEGIIKHHPDPETFLKSEGHGQASLVNIVSALGYLNLLKWLLSAKDNEKLFTLISDKYQGWIICQELILHNLSINSSLPGIEIKEISVEDNEQKNEGEYESMFTAMDKLKTYILPKLTPILTALLFEQHAAFELLVDFGFDVNQLGESGTTLLIELSTMGHLRGIKKLLKYGADVNLANSRGTTPLMLATFGEWENLVKLLIDSHADVNAEDMLGFNALMYAANYESSDSTELRMTSSHWTTVNKAKVIQLLLSNNANQLTKAQEELLDQQDNRGSSFIKSVINGDEIPEHTIGKRCTIL